MNTSFRCAIVLCNTTHEFGQVVLIHIGARSHNTVHKRELDFNYNNQFLYVFDCIGSAYLKNLPINGGSQHTLPYNHTMPQAKL